MIKQINASKIGLIAELDPEKFDLIKEIILFLKNKKHFFLIWSPLEIIWVQLHFFGLLFDRRGYFNRFLNNLGFILRVLLWIEVVGMVLHKLALWGIEITLRLYIFLLDSGWLQEIGWLLEIRRLLERRILVLIHGLKVLHWLVVMRLISHRILVHVGWILIIHGISYILLK